MKAWKMHDKDLRSYLRDALTMIFLVACNWKLSTVGLNPSTKLMVNASANRALLSKSYNEAYEILERIANNNYQWPSTRQVAI